MAAPASTPISTASPVQWSDGTLFDGYLLLGIALPTINSTAVPEINYFGQYPSQRLPIWTQIPIAAGVINANTFVFFTNQIVPPNCKYVAYWYDSAHNQISGPSTLFTITAAPYVITPPTLTVPVAAVAGPTPASFSSND